MNSREKRVLAPRSPSSSGSPIARRPAPKQGRPVPGATDHAFLAQEAEEGLVLLRGEQQGAHVGDPPGRRRLLLRRLLARAHGGAARVDGRPGLWALAPGERPRLVSVRAAGVRGAASRSPSTRRRRVRPGGSLRRKASERPAPEARRRCSRKMLAVWPGPRLR